MKKPATNNTPKVMKKPVAPAKKSTTAIPKKPPKTQAQKEAKAKLLAYQKDYISRLKQQLKEADKRLAELKNR